MLGETARMLYTTTPSLPQLGLPDWQQYVYVVEIDRNGEATQRLVTSRQAPDHAALALRRGRPELIFERHIDRPGEPATLELWSIADRALLSTRPVPAPPWPGGGTWGWGAFRLATRDGNVLFGSTRRASRNASSTIAWFESAPDGSIVGSGYTARTDISSAAGWFETRNGGAD